MTDQTPYDYESPPGGRQQAGPPPDEGRPQGDTAGETPLDGPEHESSTVFKGRYRLERLLGRGGTCSVYRAWDLKLQRYVAIKRLEPPQSDDPHIRARFEHEGKALARLSHPNVVTLIDRGSGEGDDYLVFEYAEGRSLRDLLRRGPLDPAEAVRVAGQIAEGLGAAHRLGIVHRDVKPQNILLDRTGWAKLADFGIATGPDLTTVTGAGSLVGSTRYMSPEQIRSRPVDARSDLYSLGIVLYEMLAGQAPFTGGGMTDIARQHLYSAPPPLSEAVPDLPSGLDRVVMRCLEKLPERRFQSMDELLGAFTGLGLYELQSPAAEMDAGLKGFLRRALEGGAAEEGRADGLAARTSRDEHRERARRRDQSVGGSRRGRYEASRRARRRKILYGVAAIICAAAIVTVVLLTGDSGAPSLVGQTFDAAGELAEQNGYVVEIATQVPSFESPGIVTAQTPLPGTKVSEKIIRLTVTREPEPVTVASLQDVDPEGDGQENGDQVSNLIDGETETGWSTERYRSAEFGNIKTGVGIDFELEEAAVMLQVISPLEGWRAEIIGRDPGGESKVVAELSGKADETVTFTQGVVSGRLWITLLAPVQENRYVAQIAELRFYR